MNAEIVAIGTELLLGDIVNANTAWLGSELAAVGVDVQYTQAVGDNVGRIVDALALASSRADVVITTGGLGPTQDDLTREALAELAGTTLVRDPDLEAALRSRYAALGRREFPDNNLRMAQRPTDATALPNPAGTAPGLRIEIRDAVVFALPGVPHEMREIFTQWVRPQLAERTGAVIASRVLRTVGVWESQVAAALTALDAELGVGGNPTIAYLASEGQTRVRITAKAADAAAAARMLDEVDARVRSALGEAGAFGALGDVVYGVDDETLPGVVQKMLGERGATVATAESLTGGLVGAALTSVGGASNTYRGGVVAYATSAKSELLGVSAALLQQRGAVDPDVAIAMAHGARERFGATYGLATTGVAGPEPQDGKPVGTVFVALAGERTDAVFGRRFGGDRSIIRRSTVLLALDVVRRQLLGLAPPPGESLQTQAQPEHVS